METWLQNIAPFWIWLTVACIFLIMEALVMPAGYLLCLGTAAGAVAALVFFFPDLSRLWSLTLFALFTVVAGLVWWKTLRKKRGRNIVEEDEGLLNVKTRQLVGYRAVLGEDIRGGRGRIRVNDSPWPVKADSDYPAGTLVEVTEVHGITLKVKKAEGSPPPA
ncbi:MAG: NfeD family protein [Deltaproteobacteria bacterium]|jgi:membrane protein implicated in regulation of membrane protease activity|nr:NfeD family protein [Deltaproteobacteria bacterium]